MIWDDGDNVCGNPAPVVDEMTGVVHLLSTWNMGGTTPQDQVNECTVAELPDGRVILNMRNYDRSQKNRKISFSEDGGMTWSDLVSDQTLIEPVCQASLLMSGEDEEGNRTLLFLNPAHESERCMMTLRSSKDGGLCWEGSLLLHSGPSAYSDMTILSDGVVGCLYEAGKTNPYQGIVFQQIPWFRVSK